jgi:hypothetical protein
MKTASVTAALLIAICLAALAACGDGDQSGSTSTPGLSSTRTPSSTAGPTRTAPVAPTPASAGHIRFTSNRDGNIEIYVMNADGTGQTNLTNNPPDDYDASWLS